MTNDETLALVDGLAKIARMYKLDELVVGGVAMRISHHDFPESPAPAKGDDEDLLFHSSEG